MKERLRQMLEYFGINQTEFASRTGISKATLSHILSTGGRGGNLSDATVDKIVVAFPSLNKDWIVRGVGSMVNSSSAQEPTLFSDINEAPNKPVAPIEKKTEQQRTTVNNVNQPSANTSTEYDLQPVSINISDSFNESQSEQTVYQHSSKPVNQESPKRKITRIVIFFDDNTFTEHLPQ